MRQINNSIFKLFVEINIALLFIVLSYFYWNKIDISKFEKIAATSSAISTLQIYETDNSTQDPLIPMSDSYAIKNVASKTYKVENFVNESKKYNIALIVYKDSTLDYKLISLSIDNKIYKLKNLTAIEEDQTIIFIFDEQAVKDINVHEIKIWLNKEATDDAMNQSFMYNFNLKETNNPIAFS